MITENLRNGHGYTLTEATAEESLHPTIFSEDAHAVLYASVAEGSCLAEGSVGAGKTHLLRDIGKIARKEYDLPTLLFRAHISGGSRSGVTNALRELDAFAEGRENDGIILLDNVDFYGYSGSKCRRSYGLAAAHTQVARYLGDLLSDQTAPLVAGIAHDDAWRRMKWLYSTKKGADDRVTPAAQDLLDGFVARYDFTGDITLDIAESLLVDQGFSHNDLPDLTARLINTKSLCYRIVSRLTPQSITEQGLGGAIARIEFGTQKRLGGMALASPQETSVHGYA
jgi:hypothetical protein